MTGLLSKHDFRVALQEAIAGKASAKAAFSQAWMDGTLQRHHFARWAENHYHYVGPFADYLGYIYNNARDEQDGVKDLLLQSMYEFRHLQEGEAMVSHTDLLIRFAQACGTTRERVESPQACNPIARGMQAWCYATAIRESPVVATAALLVGLASQIPQIYARQIVPLRDPRVYGFSEHEVAFFALRITSDGAHAERGYRIVLDGATTPALQQRCLQFVRWGAEMRYAYAQAIYDQYVAPDLGARRVD